MNYRCKLATDLDDSLCNAFYYMNAFSSTALVKSLSGISLIHVNSSTVKLLPSYTMRSYYIVTGTPVTLSGVLM